MLARSTIFGWLEEHEEFARRYTLARQIQIEDLMDEILEIADDSTNDWMYQGLVTFWRAPHTQDLGAVDIAVYGVPFDAGTSNRPGARFGLRAIREQSCYVGLYDQCWPNDYAFKERYRLIDCGDVASFPGRTEDMVAAVGGDRVEAGGK